MWAGDRHGYEFRAPRLSLGDDLVHRVAEPDDVFDGTVVTFFAGSMSADSSWDEILKARGIQAQFPSVGFGNTFVPINGVCLDGDKLAIADPRRDNGVRVSADQFREQARTAMAGMGDGTPPRVDRFAAAAPSAQGSLSEAPGSPIRYPVNVYKVLQSLSTINVFLFQKPWEIATCGAR